MPQYSFAFPCSYFIQRPCWFVTHDEWNQSDWRSTCGMGKQLYIKFCIWFLLIIIHTVFSQRDRSCNFHLILLLFVCILQRGHQLPLVRSQVKVTEEAHVWVPALCQVVQLVFIDQNPCLVEITKRWLLQYSPLFCYCPFWTRGHHLSLERNKIKVTKEAHVFLPAVCWMVQLVSIDYNPCPVFTKRWLLQCLPLFCSCLFLFDTEAIISHLWGIKSKWLKKHMYGYQQFVKWSRVACLYWS
jgi:hypothetical protein